MAAKAAFCVFPHPRTRLAGERECGKTQNQHEVMHLFESNSPWNAEPQARQSLFPLKQMAAKAAFCVSASLRV